MHSLNLGQRALSYGFEFFVQAGYELLSVYNTVRLYCVDVCSKHGLECGPQCLIWELEGRIIAQNLLYLGYSDSVLTLRIGILQRLVQCHFIDIHLR